MQRSPITPSPNRPFPPARWLLALVLAPLLSWAQPSGGPYGPIQQTYELPEQAETLFYVAPDGDADASGESADEPTTLEAAITRATTGDAIIMRGGTYRTGDLIINQGVTLQPYEDERPFLKGSRVASDWVAQDNDLWRTSWDTLFPAQPQGWWRREREGRKTPLYKFNNDMVFIDGQFLHAVGWEGDVDEDSYYIDYENGQVYIGTDPTDRLVEITAYDNAITRVTGEAHGRPSDKKGFTLRGIDFSQYAYRAIEIEGYDPEGVSPESEHGKDVVGTTIEHCAFTYCSRVAGYFRGDDFVFRHNLVSDTGTEGVFILASNDAVLEKNIFRRNNIEEITGYYPAAVKIFNQTHRVICRDNLVIDHPHSNGIWYDVGNEDGLFVNNWIVRTDNGFFFEISQRATVAGNVFVDCPTGIFVLNSADVEIYQNTLVNSPVKIQRTTRSAQGDHFGWHPATGPDVDERDGHILRNNLIYGDETVDTALLQVLQVEELCGELTEPQLAELDHNVYVRNDSDGPLIEWAPAKAEDGCTASFAKLEAFRDAEGDFAAHSHYLADYAGPLFRGQQTGRYELMPDFPAADAAGPLPAEVVEALGTAYEDVSFPGAFPVRE